MAHVLLPNNLFDRKSEYESALFNKVGRNVSSWRKRQMILAGDPDLLSEAELLNHRFENKLKKVTKFLVLFGGSAAVYYYKRSPVFTAASFAILFTLQKTLINTINYTSCDYSMKLAYDSIHQNAESVHAFNGGHKVTYREFLGLPDPKVAWYMRETDDQALDIENLRHQNQQQL